MNVHSLMQMHDVCDESQVVAGDLQIGKGARL